MNLIRSVECKFDRNSLIVKDLIRKHNSYCKWDICFCKIKFNILQVEDNSSSIDPKSLVTCDRRKSKGVDPSFLYKRTD